LTVSLTSWLNISRASTKFFLVGCFVQFLEILLAGAVKVVGFLGDSCFYHRLKINIVSGAPAELWTAAVELCVAVHDVPDLVGHVQPAGPQL
jgi:hypothetical protein